MKRPAYEAQIHGAGRAARSGRRDRLDRFHPRRFGQLGKLDLLVLPSLFGEGLPMVVLEAMAAGVPVVATRVEGVPEAIRDGVDGLIVAPDDPRALADAIGRCVRGEVDWAAMRVAAHRRQAAMFSDRAMAEGVAHVYREVLTS